jgi:hypothetical protein
MGLLANFKARRSAKKAKAIYELDLYNWQEEKQVLEQALEIFTNASAGKEPEDHQLVQKKGEVILWSGEAIYHEAGRTPSTYKGGSRGVSIPVVAGVRVRVGQFSGSVVPGQEMQIDKDQGLVKLTNQRLIFAGSLNTTEWAFAKILSAARNEAGDDFIIGVSNRKKTSGVRFSDQDGKAFARLFALALYAYENGIPKTVTEIKSALKTNTANKPKLLLTDSKASKSKGELSKGSNQIEHNI